MFRAIDWLTMAVTFGIIWIIYLCTLAPEQTLEDSGELCTGAFYAGIPHPPGYPFWSVYAWFWTAILPFGNVAWRVEEGESFAAAMGCGLLALMVSRGSNMLIEGVEAIKNLPRQWENGICAVSGLVAGTLLGLDGFMWSESVVINRISLFGVPWLIAVLACLMRWMYAPQQRRYLYLAMFLYGLCATIHQTLLLSAMGIEVAIALAAPKLGRDMFLCNSLIFLVGLVLMSSIPALHDMSQIERDLFFIAGLGSLAVTFWLAMKTRGLASEWKAVLIMGVAWAIGVSAYFYEAVSCMTDPPMQWGYPRTVQGFFHALSRGQYGTANSYNIFQDPARFAFQLKYIFQGLTESFSIVYVFIGLLPFAFLFKMHKRERSWIIGLTSIYFCLSVILVVLINVSADLQSVVLNKVFFTASHGLFAMMIGYGLALLAAYTATNYQKVRVWGFALGSVAVILAIYSLLDVAGSVYHGPGVTASFSELWRNITQAFDPYHYGLPIFANLILLAIPLCLIGAFLAYRQRGPVLIMLILYCAMPTWSGLSHWYKSEQHNHWFGFWFGHDMFTPPFTDPKTGQLTYDNDLRAQLLKNPTNATVIYPEMDRNTILYGGTDPGRFCPTYSIFCDSFIPHSCQPAQDQKFDRRDCYLITQNALVDGPYLDYLRAQYNRSQQVDPPFFSGLVRYVAALLHVGTPGAVIMEGHGMGTGNTGNALVEGVCNLLNNTLDNWFTQWGAHVEKCRRARGVYPSAEICIASEAESQRCAQDYLQDKARRAQIGQLRPGESPPDPVSGRISIGNQFEIMAINGLVAKVIFDQNPTNSFYVEESLAIDWMYPHETPFGIIMKINRNPQPEFADDVFKLDHQFWTDYSKRLCGNWITYDTTVKEIADFAERVYIQKDYRGYTGDRAFLRDEDAQKAFSKLRSSQAGMYYWRCALPGSVPTCPPEYHQKTSGQPAGAHPRNRFCLQAIPGVLSVHARKPCSATSFFLVGLAQNEEINGHPDKPPVISTAPFWWAKPAGNLTRFNDQITGLVKGVQGFESQIAQQTKDFQEAADQIRAMESMAQTNPANVQNLVLLGSAYIQMQQSDRALKLFDVALARPEISVVDAQSIAQYCAQLGDLPRCQKAIEKLVALAPDQPEPHYDLAALDAVLGRSPAAMQELKTALDLNSRRLAADPKATDLLETARTDDRLKNLRSLPQFQKLVLTK